ncbi:MaoC/PaaZ C-terminal domain-containing protein [Kitasatospora sp. NPDC057542]|uniref:MaoC family dehydratase n=1 Tax=Streptomycetaceae TaxID=2062 RepID=UPI0021E14678|nr:MaoC family dehydratase [Streptomyces sp. LS1784]
MTAPTTTPAPTATPAAPGPLSRTRLHVSAQDLAAYRAAARAHLPAPHPRAASPAHPFVAAHALAQHTVTTLTAGDSAFTGVIHLAQEIHTHTPLTPGDLDVTVEVTAVRREARGTRLALTTRLTDAATGTPLADLVTAALLLGATRTEPHGTLAPAAHPGTTPDGDTHTSTHVLTAADTTAYAHACGDLNPIHLDEDAAKAAGFPGTITHGMHLLALAAEQITDRHAGGDATRLTALGARFAAPTRPGTELRLTLQPHDRGTVVRFTIATDTGTAVKAGWARIAPAGE